MNDDGNNIVLLEDLKRERAAAQVEQQWEQRWAIIDLAIEQLRATNMSSSQIERIFRFSALELSYSAVSKAGM